MTSATSGCLFFTLGMQSAQLAQWAASTLPAARHNPSPPKFEGTPAALRALSESPAIPTNWQKHVHSALSWACEKASDSGGRTMRRWKLTRGAAQNKRSNHALWRSRTAGILCSRVACLVNCHIQLGSDELVASDGGSKDFQAPHGWIQTGVTPSKPLPPGPQLVLWRSTPPCLLAPRPHGSALVSCRRGPGSELAPTTPQPKR